MNNKVSDVKNNEVVNQTGCATDLDGNFTLQNVKPEQTLTISYIGYTAQTIAIL